MNPTSTLGPRGDIGVNRNFVSPSLEVLPMLVEHVDSAPGNKAKFVESRSEVVLTTNPR